MRCAVDLHIHSCLSPCGDALMTPNNIVNMAKIKGLDMIAVADHNTARHLPAIERVARRVGVSLLPAMELCSREEVHVLSYFKTVEDALSFSEDIYDLLPPILNRPSIFGPQTELDENDEIVREEEKLLISALDLSIDALSERIYAAGGLSVPAHINRGANGILQALGFLPPALRLSGIELSRSAPRPETALPPVQILYSSDAHYLGNILERSEFLDLISPDPAGFFSFMGA